MTAVVAAKWGRVLLVRRKRDHLWMFPGGRKRARNGKGLPDSGNQGRTPETKARRTFTLERRQGQEPKVRTIDERQTAKFSFARWTHVSTVSRLLAE
jgi:ADP-ribose pyrophosphatase YjhB (NUDIX family)